MKISKLILAVILSSYIFACKNDNKTESMSSLNSNEKQDPLPSFNEGATKTSIIEFVESIVNPNNKDFVTPADRIVCFDNDGTLWVEQPLPTQIYFDFDRIKGLAKEQPELATTQPYKAIVDNDMATIKTFGVNELIQIVGTAHRVHNIDLFDSIVKSWLQKAKHPVLNKPFTALIYQPMLELLDYLRANEFKIYIVSGGSQEFMRVWVPNVYGVPKENIIGSTFKKEVTIVNDKINVSQTNNFEFNDDHEGKVIAINTLIGKKPIMVVGNSDGDLEMMQYCDTNLLPHFLLYLKHTDADREFLYDKHTLAGKLIKGEEVAKEKNWTIIDMKTDWNKVFPDNIKE